MGFWVPRFKIFSMFGSIAIATHEPRPALKLRPENLEAAWSLVRRLFREERRRQTLNLKPETQGARVLGLRCRSESVL